MIRFLLLCALPISSFLGLGYQEPETSQTDWQDSFPVCMNKNIAEFSPPLLWTNRRPFSSMFWHDGAWAANVQEPSLPDFSDNPLAAELCQAILEKDLDQMNRAIEEGADVNAVSKTQTTPLFLAYCLKTDPRPFYCLLKHGADPNATVNSIGSDVVSVLWDSETAIVHLVAFGRYNRLFKAVFEHGGDPNLRWEIDTLETSTTPFRLLHEESPDVFERLELLIRCGANLDDLDTGGWTETHSWLKWRIDISNYGRHCRLALSVLKAGASFRLAAKRGVGYDKGSLYDGCYFHPIHFLAEAESEIGKLPADQQVQYRAVIQWLEEHGGSLKQAKADLGRWKNWIENGRADLIEKEHEERQREEAKAKNVEQETSQNDWQQLLPVCMNEKVTRFSPPGWENSVTAFSDIYWHDTFYWWPGFDGLKEPDFSDNPKAAKLCKAITKKNVAEMERLIADGAEVNAVSKDGITPLFFAFHFPRDPRPFACLLEHGADPNLPVNPTCIDDLMISSLSGASAVHLVAHGDYNRLFKTVFEHGGDANLRRDVSLGQFSTTPFLMIRHDAPDAVERMEFLVQCGANLNDRFASGATKLIQSTNMNAAGQHYDQSCRLALALLNAGADFRLDAKSGPCSNQKDYIYYHCYFRPIHFLAEAEPEVAKLPADQQVHFRVVIQWLEEHGDSLNQAKADLERWKNWIGSGQLELIEKEHEAWLKEKAEVTSDTTNGGRFRLSDKRG